MFMKWGVMLIFMSMFNLLMSFFCLEFEKIFMVEYYLFLLSNFELKMFFVFDWMSLMFVSVVLFISGMVVIYSNDYMSGEKYKFYFLYGVLLFVGSMILMIVSPNLFMILLGWDGLGLVSYCLVIYYQNYKSDAAGMITILSNRVGDVMILLSFVYLLNFGTLDFFIYEKMYWVCGFMLVIAGMTKSAQIPFSAWLPAAMAAPTPVSSLVHSSTLVTAGVYLLIRLNLLMNIKEYSNFLLFFSVLTMMMAGMGAMIETDLKKVIALSTLSQLGLMMMILSLGKYDLSFFHLVTHALFKAMLFLCAGFMIHSSLGSQDIRFMGNFYLMNPLIGVAFSLANMALFGIPFLSGFYSKDMILEFIYLSSYNLLFMVMIIFSTICTVVYSLRVMFYSLWSGGLKMVNFNYHWSAAMEIPIFIMGIAVLFFGSMMSWILELSYEMILLNFETKLINLIIIVSGIYMFVMVFEKVGEMNLGIIGEFLGNMWFMSSFSGPILSNKIIHGMNYNNYDNGWLEEVGPQGFYKLNSMFSMFVTWLQMNSFKNMILFWLILFILMMI
uniref:NADH dehydrogenase subunit 5 n=1 Tax=Alectorobius puertoricensis TaxID=48824 RepID=UPI002236FFB3|nr:NADH dehydrogenase subunit 5 [Alectorobius puertoricensis]UYB78542.1 NADH dehydrogenase subunit 5 [Alectorobius puertoricensis]UYB78555.1 NADH dehydrogenase subunit 5 [Alectorobius puertoricensis]